MTDPKIYVACLAAYNSGILHGAWIDATEDAEEMREEVAKMLAASPAEGAEEWAIHDHEGLGRLGEWANLEEVSKRVQIGAVAEEWDIPAEVLITAMEEHNGDLDDEPRGFLGDHYAGRADSWEDFAETWCSDIYDMHEVPKWLENHIDWDSVARDMRFGGDFNAVLSGGEHFFFWNH